MKRVILFLSLMFTSVFALFAITETTHESVLNVKAYKIGNNGEKYLTLSVFDALTGTLETVNTGDTIDLTHYTNKIMNPISDDSSYSLSPYDEHVVFSLRLSGNASTPSSGKLSCSVTITPFQQKDSENNVISSIDAYFEMRDVTCVFTTNYKTTTETGGTITLNKGTTSGIASSSNITMGFNMTIDVGSVKLENWRAQASVGVSIKNSSYESAQSGSHYATVTIGVVTES